jgi:hypothetical protein
MNKQPGQTSIKISFLKKKIGRWTMSETYAGREMSETFSGRTMSKIFSGRTMSKKFSGRTMSELFSGRTMSEICSGRTMSEKWFRGYNVRKCSGGTMSKGDNVHLLIPITDQGIQ